MKELQVNMAILGKEATAALAAVEAQQQRLTFQRLVSMVSIRLTILWAHLELRRFKRWSVISCVMFDLKVEGERSYHQRVAAVLIGIESEVTFLTICDFVL